MEGQLGKAGEGSELTPAINPGTLPAAPGTRPATHMTTSPDGEPVPVEQRLAEIRDRYGSGDLVSRSMRRGMALMDCSRCSN